MAKLLKIETKWTDASRVHIAILSNGERVRWAGRTYQEVEAFYAGRA
jgi:hypothetical protein